MRCCAAVLACPSTGHCSRGEGRLLQSSAGGVDVLMYCDFHGIIAGGRPNNGGFLDVVNDACDETWRPGPAGRSPVGCARPGSFLKKLFDKGGIQAPSMLHFSSLCPRQSTTPRLYLGLLIVAEAQSHCDISGLNIGLFCCCCCFTTADNPLDTKVIVGSPAAI